MDHDANRASFYIGAIGTVGQQRVQVDVLGGGRESECEKGNEECEETCHDLEVEGKFERKDTKGLYFRVVQRCWAVL